MFKTFPEPAYAHVSITKLTKSAIFLWGSIDFMTSIEVSTRLYCPRKSNPRPKAKIL